MKRILVGIGAILLAVVAICILLVAWVVSMFSDRLADFLGDSAINMLKQHTELMLVWGTITEDEAKKLKDILEGKY